MLGYRNDVIEQPMGWQSYPGLCLSLEEMACGEQASKSFSGSRRDTLSLESLTLQKQRMGVCADGFD